MHPAYLAGHGHNVAALGSEASRLGLEGQLVATHGHEWVPDMKRKHTVHPGQPPQTAPCWMIAYLVTARWGKHPTSAHGLASASVPVSPA